MWRCPDEHWENFNEPTLRRLDPPAKTRRSRIDPRRALDGMICQLRTDCQWHALPCEFGGDRPIHRLFQRWFARGVIDEVCALLDRATSCLQIRAAARSSGGSIAAPGPRLSPGRAPGAMTGGPAGEHACAGTEVGGSSWRSRSGLRAEVDA
ncbi:MAG: transposase [Phycisphaeraceae bacterium]|nr:transposase [Phycisphaeraceae bacterium]